MKYAPAFFVAATALMIGAPLAHAASATVILNGQDVPINGDVSCSVTYQGFTLLIGHDQGAAIVVVGHTPAWDNQPTKVTQVGITDASRAAYAWDLVGQLTNGDAQYNGPPDPDLASAGTYKITGHVPMIMLPPSPAPGAPPPIGGNAVNGALLPFEIDASCP